METFRIARIIEKWPTTIVAFGGADVVDEEGKPHRLSEETFGDDWQYVKQWARIELVSSIKARVIEKAPSHQSGHK